MWSRNVPLVLTARLHRPLEPRWRAAGWGDVRLHEGAEPPWPHDATSALQDWADRIAARWSDDEDVFVYFNNDPGCYAVAIDVATCVTNAGRTPTRVPALLTW